MDAVIHRIPDDYVIKPYIDAHRAEVDEILLKEYNEAEAMEMFKNDGRIEQRDADARGMYAEGLMPDVIARIQNIPVKLVNQILGLDKGSRMA